MKNYKNALIISATAFALIAGAGAASAQVQQQDTKSGSQTSPMNKSGSQPQTGKGGTMTKSETPGQATQDVNKKAQDGAKENSMAPNKGGTMTKSETPGQATQDVEKKSQQGNMPKK